MDIEIKPLFPDAMANYEEGSAKLVFDRSDQSNIPKVLLEFPKIQTNDENESADRYLFRYEIDPLAIGSGSFGIVNRVREKSTGTYYAMKSVNIQKFVELHSGTANKQKAKAQIEGEIRLQSQVKSPHIVAIKEWFESGDTFFIIMELAKQNLLQFIQEQKSHLDQPKILEMFLQLCRGLKAVHDCGIIHRDINPKNIVLCENGNLKIIDFGLARACQCASTMVGTPLFMAPEIANSENYSQSADIFSLGCVLYFMMSLKSAFKQYNGIAQTLSGICEEEPDDLPLNLYTKDITQICQLMMSKDPKRRPTIDEIILKLERQQNNNFGPESSAQLQKTQESDLSKIATEITQKTQEIIIKYQILLKNVDLMKIQVYPFLSAQLKSIEAENKKLFYKKRINSEVFFDICNILILNMLSLGKDLPDIMKALQQLYDNFSTLKEDIGQYYGETSNINEIQYQKRELDDGQILIGAFNSCGMIGFGRHVKQHQTIQCQFLHNKKQGIGNILFINGDEYIGQFHNNSVSGIGQRLYRNGDKYEGEWKNNQMNGKGYFSYANGDQFFGDWKDGRKNGIGKYIYANGEICFGEWIDDIYQKDNIKRKHLDLPILQKKEMQYWTVAQNNIAEVQVSLTIESQSLPIWSWIPDHQMTSDKTISLSRKISKIINCGNESKFLHRLASQPFCEKQLMANFNGEQILIFAVQQFMEPLTSQEVAQFQRNNENDVISNNNTSFNEFITFEKEQEQASDINRVPNQCRVKPLQSLIIDNRKIFCISIIVALKQQQINLTQSALISTSLQYQLKQIAYSFNLQFLKISLSQIRNNISNYVDQINRVILQCKNSFKLNTASIQSISQIISFANKNQFNLLKQKQYYQENKLNFCSVTNFINNYSSENNEYEMLFHDLPSMLQPNIQVNESTLDNTIYHSDQFQTIWNINSKLLNVSKQNLVLQQHVEKEIVFQNDIISANYIIKQYNDEEISNSILNITSQIVLDSIVQSLYLNKFRMIIIGPNQITKVLQNTLSIIFPPYCRTKIINVEKSENFDQLENKELCLNNQEQGNKIQQQMQRDIPKYIPLIVKGSTIQCIHGNSETLIDLDYIQQLNEPACIVNLCSKKINDVVHNLGSHKQFQQVQNQVQQVLLNNIQYDDVTNIMQKYKLNLELTDNSIFPSFSGQIKSANQLQLFNLLQLSVAKYVAEYSIGCALLDFNKQKNALISQLSDIELTSIFTNGLFMGMNKIPTYTPTYYKNSVSLRAFFTSVEIVSTNLVQQAICFPVSWLDDSKGTFQQSFQRIISSLDVMGIDINEQMYDLYASIIEYLVGGVRQFLEVERLV